EGYTLRTERSGAEHFNAFKACRALALKHSNNVILDAKLSADNPTEMHDAIRSVQARAKKHGTMYFTHLTANYLLPAAALETFVEKLPTEIQPIFILPTSRYTVDDLDRLGANVGDNIIEKAAK